MALVPCAECGHRISPRAAACPQCGHPADPGTPRTPDRTDPLPFFRMFGEICVHPRRTIRHILDRHPGFAVWRLVFLCVLCAALDPSYVSSLCLGASPWPFLPLCLFALGVNTVVAFGLETLFLFLMGRMLKSRSTLKEIATAYAWTTPAVVLMGLITLTADFHYWLSLFDHQTYFMGWAVDWTWHLKWLTWAVWPASLWGFVLCIVNLAEAYRFSWAKTTVIVFFAFWLGILEDICFHHLILGMFTVHY